MKIINKENIKWWGNQESETWAYKENGDWYLLKSNKQSKSKGKAKVKKSSKEPQINWKQLAFSCVIGAWTAACIFGLSLTYLLLKNAF